MKNISLIILFFLAFNSIELKSQQLDSFLIATCFNHYIENGAISQKKYASSQKTYNRKSQLIREVHYSDETFQPELIYYYHYNDNGLLIFKEGITLENEPSHYVEYTYDNDKLINQTEYKFTGKTANLVKKIKFKYENNDIIIEKHYNGKKKKSMTVTKDNSNPKQKIINTIYHINDSLNSETSIYNYDGNGLTSIKHIFQYKSGVSDTTTTKYNYDNSKRISKIEDFNADGKLITRYSYLYFADGRISSVNRVNSSFKVISNKSYVYLESDLVFPDRPIPIIK